MKSCITIGEDAKDTVSHIDDTRIRDLGDPARGQHYAKEGDAAIMATEVSDRYTDSIPGAPVVNEVAVENESFPTVVSLNCGWHSASLVKVRQDWHQLNIPIKWKQSSLCHVNH